jgi:hypothetical protein
MVGRPQTRVSGLLHRLLNRCKARGVWHCARFAPPVSMVRSPTETGGEARDVELPQSELGLREDATAERRPIGSTDESVRCAAFTIRSAPTLPVPPGCEIRVASLAMRGSMPSRVCTRSRKIESRREWFFRCQCRARSVPSTRCGPLPACSKSEHPGTSTTGVALCGYFAVKYAGLRTPRAG